ncbi:ABC transporter permease [Microbulbifer sp. DLAB2-AA]|uniref:ABC transporter permease n=1 Tax=Microbulbifer sp. DLAB2-AA TaxID=3243394 RepID=UPI00403908CF
MLRNYFSIIWVRGIGALKADAEDSYLGTLWWVLEPLLLSCLFYIAFSGGLKGEGRGTDFFYFLICALMPFKWTSSAINTCSSSITSNMGILGQFYLPKWIFPTATNLSLLVRFFIIIPVILLFLIIGGHSPSLEWGYLIPIIICQLLINLGIGYLTAAVTPLIPDLKHLIPLGITAIMFTSGIFFDISTRPEETQAILAFNPFVNIFNAYRTVLLAGEGLELSKLLYPCLFGVSAAIVGLALILKLDRYYPRLPA